MTDRTFEISGADRADLVAFVANVVRMDEAAVVRLRARTDGWVAAWAVTGFDVLATRVVRAALRPDDVTVAADVLVRGLGGGEGPVDLGYPMESAWRGALPPEQGFRHVDDVPARVLVDLADRGASAATESPGGHGPPVSLLDQDVLTVSAASDTVPIPMRAVFALVAMGFVPDAGVSASAVDPAEPVRVRVTDTWLRLDARFGSVARRRGGGLPLLAGRSG